MAISIKKKTELYGLIHEEITQARIKIWKTRNDKIISIAEIDQILFELCVSTPDKVIEYLCPQTQPSTEH